MSYYCDTEVRGRISGAVSFGLGISETDCDTLAKTSTISLFASKPGQTSKVLLFKFFPAYGDPMPVISAVDRQTVRISIAEISSVFLYRDKLNDLTVDSQIGAIDYPDAGAENKLWRSNR